jgi:hypothetical protein|nr:hypothetical protein [Kofleriaceae bacterium]
MRKLLLVTALALVSAGGCSKTDTAEATPSGAKPDKPAKAELPTMTVDEVDQQVAAKQVTAVDCNGDMLRKKVGVVPGAILVSSPDDYAASALPADKTAKLVFYCADPG